MNRELKTLCLIFGVFLISFLLGSWIGTYFDLKFKVLAFIVTILFLIWSNLILNKLIEKEINGCEK